MQDQYSRTQLLLGKEAMEKLHNSRVAVFGIGGVGGYTVEALARSGVGALDLIDDDKVCLTNLNRQIVATRKTVGQYKRRIKHLKVVYSKEPAMTPIEDDSISCKNHCICPPGTQRKCTIRRSVPGSNAFVPSVAGLIIGGEVVKDLVGFVPMKG